MNAVWSDEFTFCAGAAIGHDELILAVSKDDLEDESIAHTVFLTYRTGQWMAVANPVLWNCVSLCRLGSAALAMGWDGELLVVHADTSVGPFAGLPRDSISKRGPMRKLLSATGSSVLAAVGTDMQLYFYSSGGWHESPHASGDAASGETSLETGVFRGEQFIAFGTEGTALRVSNSHRKLLNIGTNASINAAAGVQDGVVFGASDGRLYELKEDEECVTELTSRSADSPIWDLCCFEGKIYAATLSQLYVLENGKLLPAHQEAATSGVLTWFEGQLWSIGEKDIFICEKERWRRIE